MKKHTLKLLAAVVMATGTGAIATPPTITVVPTQWENPYDPFGPISGSSISVNNISADGSIISGTFRTASPGSGSDDRPYVYNLSSGGTLVTVLEDSQNFASTHQSGMSSDGTIVLGTGNIPSKQSGVVDGEVWNTTGSSPSGEGYNYGVSLPTTYTLRASTTNITNAHPLAASNAGGEVVGTQFASDLTTTLPTIWQLNGSSYNNPLTMTDGTGVTVGGTPYAVSPDGSTVYLQNGSTYTQWTASGSANLSNGTIAGTVSLSTNINASPLFSLTSHQTFWTPALGTQNITDYLDNLGLGSQLWPAGPISIDGMSVFQLVNNNTQVEIGSTINENSGAVVIKFDLPSAANTAIWNVDANGQWGTNSNWTAPSPNAPGAFAFFNNINSTPRSITLEGDKTVADLTFNSSQAYTLNGPGVLHLSAPLTAQINDLNGSHTINTALTAQVTDSAQDTAYGYPGVFIDVANAGDTLTLAGPTFTVIPSTGNSEQYLNGPPILYKQGLGALTLSSSMSLVGVQELQINQGTLNVGSLSANGAQGTMNITVGGYYANRQGPYTFAHLTATNIREAVLYIVDNSVGIPSTVQILPQTGAHNNSANVSVVSNLFMSSGVLDLNNNDMIVGNGNLSRVNSYLKTGFSNGTWAGQSGQGNIDSSSAMSDPTHLTALGSMLNADGSGNVIYNTFDGQAVTAFDVLIKYTYYGDANLNGQVDSSDYSRIDGAYLNNQSVSNSKLTGWYNGDFNYDGVVNGSDYTLIDNAFNTQGSSFGDGSSTFASQPTAQITAEIASAPAGTTSVPEPLGIVFLLPAALLSLRRRQTKPIQ